jgi:hypothetical protein
MMDRERVFPEWIKTGLSIVMAAVSAYWGIRVDLAMTMKDVAYLQATAQRHEAAIERLRDGAAAQAAAAPVQSSGMGSMGAGAGLRAR